MAVDFEVIVYKSNINSRILGQMRNLSRCIQMCAFIEFVHNGLHLILQRP